MKIICTGKSFVQRKTQKSLSCEQLFIKTDWTRFGISCCDKLQEGTVFQKRGQEFNFKDFLKLAKVPAFLIFIDLYSIVQKFYRLLSYMYESQFLSTWKYCLKIFRPTALLRFSIVYEAFIMRPLVLPNGVDFSAGDFRAIFPSFL